MTLEIVSVREEETSVVCGDCKTNEFTVKQFITYKSNNGRIYPECDDYKCKKCGREWSPARGLSI